MRGTKGVPEFTCKRARHVLAHACSMHSRRIGPSPARFPLCTGETLFVPCAAMAARRPRPPPRGVAVASLPTPSPRLARARNRVGGWGPGRAGVSRVQNIAHTTFPMPFGGVQPHLSLSAQIMCSPRPVSVRAPRVLGTGTTTLGSATAHRMQGPCCSSPSRIGPRDRVSPESGRACCNALVSSSDTTIVISPLRLATPHRCNVVAVKSRAARTDPASTPGVRVAIRGEQVQPGAGSGDSGQFPLARPAISAAGASQWQPVLAARRDGCAAIASPINPVATGRKQARAPASCRCAGGTPPRRILGSLAIRPCSPVRQALSGDGGHELAEIRPRSSSGP